jgi:uncharacterized membrane protein YphA (DoxX/SURF4 family)
MAGAASRPAVASDVAGADVRLNRLTAPLLGLVRIAIGYLWFTQTQWKMPPDFGCGTDAQTGLQAWMGKKLVDLPPEQLERELAGQGLCDWVGKEIAHPRFEFYQRFLINTIHPQLGTLGWLIYLGELTTAVLLILGLLTRLGGLIGFLQGVNLTIGLWAVPDEWYWTYILLALVNLTLALTAAGRYLGVDALLHPRAEAAAARGNGLARLVAALT